MALIKCPECEREVSNKARACPACAYPLEATTIEATGKKWKRLELIGMLLMVLGMIALINFFSAELLTYAPYAGASIFLGFIIFCYARFGRWWHHG